MDNDNGNSVTHRRRHEFSFASPLQAFQLVDGICQLALVSCLVADDPISRDTAPDALVKGVKRGVLVTRFWYSNIIDAKTLSITALTRDGTFLIEDGVVTQPIKPDARSSRGGTGRYYLRYFPNVHTKLTIGANKNELSPLNGVRTPRSAESRSPRKRTPPDRIAPCLKA